MKLTLSRFSVVVVAVVVASKVAREARVVRVTGRGRPQENVETQQEQNHHETKRDDPGKQRTFRTFVARPAKRIKLFCTHGTGEGKGGEGGRPL